MRAMRSASCETVIRKKALEAYAASTATAYVVEQLFDISEVIRRTGLTARALRFYEARGLVSPLRTASGRRLFGSGELARLNHVVVLKAAGFSLSDIGKVLNGKNVDLARLISAQVAALDARQATLAEARRLLLAAKSRVDRGEPLDAATLCSLIKSGTTTMKHENWKAVTDRYFSPEERARWAEKMPAPGTFDQESYSRKWTELGERIAARLPLDPASAKAQALYDEWQALLAPFKAVATPEMMAGATKLYDRMPEWQGDQKPPFPFEVWTFIKDVRAARQRVGTGSAPE
jgi:DNA-binding transcriptional MerR regulator